MKLSLTYEFFQLKDGEYSYQGIALPSEDPLFENPYFSNCFFKISFKNINEGKKIQSFVKEKIFQLNKKTLKPFNLEKEFSNCNANFMKFAPEKISEECLFCGPSYDSSITSFMGDFAVKYRHI